MRKFAVIFISYIFPVVVIGYIFLNVTPQSIVLTLSEVQPLWLVLGLVLYIINYFFRSIRFKILIHSRDIPFKDIFQVSCFHSMYNYLLPARTGEFSYIYYLKRLTHTPITEGLSTLLAARMLDLLVTFLFLPFAIFFLQGRISNGYLQVIVVCASFVIFFSFLVVYFVVRGRKSLRMLDRFLAFLKIAERSIVKKIRGKLGEFHISFETICRKRVYFRAFLLTLCIWFSVYGYFFMIIRSLQVEINFWQVVLILIIMVPTRLLPIQGVGNVGTHEIGWGVAFRIFGFSQGDALLVAFNSHVVLLMYVLVLGGYAFLSTRGVS